jgi:hypothetical protein
VAIAPPMPVFGVAVAVGVGVATVGAIKGGVVETGVAVLKVGVAVPTVGLAVPYMGGVAVVEGPSVVLGVMRLLRRLLTPRPGAFVPSEGNCLQVRGVARYHLWAAEHHDDDGGAALDAETDWKLARRAARSSAGWNLLQCPLLTHRQLSPAAEKPEGWLKLCSSS